MEGSKRVTKKGCPKLRQAFHRMRRYAPRPLPSFQSSSRRCTMVRSSRWSSSRRLRRPCTARFPLSAPALLSSREPECETRRLMSRGEREALGKQIHKAPKGVPNALTGPTTQCAAKLRSISKQQSKAASRELPAFFRFRSCVRNETTDGVETGDFPDKANRNAAKISLDHALQKKACSAVTLFAQLQTFFVNK